MQTIKSVFFSRVAHLLSESQTSAFTESDSNTLAIPVAKVTPGLPFGLDYKVVNGTTFLRVGFGVHNLEYHLDALVEVFEAEGVLD